MLNWGGKNWRPGAPSNRKQPINQSIEELMKPLGEKTFQGNVWGSVIMNVPQQSPIPDVTPTPTPSITPTNTQTPTPSTTLGATATPTPTNTSTQTPTPSTTTTLTPTQTPTNTQTPTPTVTPSFTPTPTSTSTPLPDADATAYLNAVIASGGTLNSTISAATYTLFDSLKSNGLYSKLTYMYPILGGVNNSVIINAKNPGVFDIQLIGNMISSYSGCSRNLLFNNNGGKIPNLYVSAFTTSDLSVSIYSNDGGLNDGGYDWAWFDGSNGVDGIIHYGNNTMYFRTGGSYLTATNNSTTGYFIWNADVSGRQIYKNGSSLNTNGDTTWVVPNAELHLWILSTFNLQGVSRRYAFVHFGTQLTAGEASTLSTIINTFQTTLGRNTY